MLSHIKRWYDGESKMQEFDNDPESSLFMMPHFYTEYHWSAKIARSIAGFYLQHWQWVWSAIIGVIGLYVATLALK
jgi:hypothetical protein